MRESNIIPIQNLAIGLPTVAIPLVFWYIIDINLKEIKTFALILEALCVVVFCLSFKKNRIGKIALNTQLVLCSLFLFFAFFEITGRFFPNVFPYQIRVFLKSDAGQHDRQAMIQYLDQSPWMKFKPNVTVRLPGFREPADRFSYSWQTDDLGYKNDANLLAKPITAVALGDSFTEAMGCKTENTWATLLGAKGFPTYSMGVHGYAPSQMATTYRNYGQDFTPKYVFIGYTETIFQREKLFLDLTEKNKEELQKNGLSAMANLNLLLGRQEVRLVTKSPVLATVMFVMSQNDPLFLKKISNISFSNAEVNKDVFLRYFNDLKYIDNNIPAIKLIENSPEWTKSMNSLLTIKELADKKGAKTILIYFPSRHTIYYKKIIGQSIPEEKDYGAKEKKAIHDFCATNGIVFVDISPSLESYVAALPITATVDELPYFEFDMHMNPTGQHIIADTVAASLTPN
ncbi:MAG: hypothetical protein AAGU21_09025 [Solidesulfovibrio sp.]|uniref:hypothetical protein n=1 Tax=Solidesulfovibrio sp. TaxID=2910990 RepID=UPI0031589CEC